MSRVVVNFYDISKGAARLISPVLLGRPIEGVWHTGVVVFGKEYFFGGGILHVPPEEMIHYDVTLFKTEEKGVTHKTKEEFHQFLSSVFEDFTMAKYDLIHWNCNHFTDACLKFLLNINLQDDVLKQHEEILNTRMGPSIIRMIELSQRVMQQQAGATSDTLWTTSAMNPHAFVPIGGTTSAGATSSFAAEGNTRTSTRGAATDDRSGAPPSAGVYGATRGSAPVSESDSQRNALLSRLTRARADLGDGGAERLRAAINLLDVIAKNILEKSTDPKYRTIKKSGSKFSSTVLSIPGASKLLTLMGFVETEDTFEFPQPNAQNLMNLMSIRRLLGRFDVERNQFEENDSIAGSRGGLPAGPSLFGNRQAGSAGVASPASVNPAQFSQVADTIGSLLRNLNFGSSSGGQNGGDPFANILGALAGQSAGRAVPSGMQAESPEVLYATQLTHLEAMGFGRSACLRALQDTNGNVNAALDKLLGDSN